MTESFALSYHDSALTFVVDDAAGISGALGFLSSHFARTAASSAKPVATIVVHPLSSPDRPVLTDGEHIYVRKSASEFFTVPALRTRAAREEVLVCEKTGTTFVFEADKRQITAFVGADSQLDLIELVRDIVLKDQENRGAVVLHGTAAVRDGRAILITGLKGAGKSTVLLELVEHFGYTVLSGDKTLVRRDALGGTVVTGWPDYPHLGFATIDKYPGLREIAGITDDYVPNPDHAFSPIGKFAVDPLAFRDRFPSAPLDISAPVEAILFPRIGPGEETVLTRLEWSSPAVARERIESLDESPYSGRHSDWHRFITADTARHAERRAAIIGDLAGVPAWSVEGPGDFAHLSVLPWEQDTANV